MSERDDWNRFWVTGSTDDYLRVKRQRKQEREGVSQGNTGATIDDVNSAEGDRPAGSAI